jgi:AAA family ATP:ADP antiporter
MITKSHITPPTKPKQQNPPKLKQPRPSSVAAVEVIRKVIGYALIRPAREVLFTVVSRREKYSAKLVVDMVVQRAGDSVAAAAFQVLDVQLRLGVAGVAAAGGVMCAVWLVAALKLGRMHGALARDLQKKRDQQQQQQHYHTKQSV